MKMDRLTKDIHYDIFLYHRCRSLVGDSLNKKTEQLLLFTYPENNIPSL